MFYTCLLPWLKQNFVACLSLLISLITSRIGYLAYKKFLVRKAQEKQLDVVLSLIDCIHKNKNHVQFLSTTKVEVESLKHFSLFDIADSDDFNTGNDLYFNVIPNDTIHFFKWGFFNDFYTNPLLPKVIAVELAKFKFAPTDLRLQYPLLKYTVVIGLPSRISEKYNFVHYAGDSNRHLKTDTDFKNASIKLKKAIINWLKDYGLNDINLAEKI